jgi:Rieske Fe-S protein
MTSINRRDFLASLAAAAGAGTCACGAGGCATFTKTGNTPAIAADAYTIEGRTATLRLGQVPELASVGGAVKILDPRLPQPIIVGRAGQAEYIAVSLLCTHRGAEVEYRHKEGQFRCASLGHSRFDPDGSRKRGPARRPLQRFETHLTPDGQGGTLVVSL